MSDHFTTAHVAQLHEIERVRLRRGQSGIGPMVEDLIRRLTDGGVAGKTSDVRIAQAKRYWDLGIGKALDYVSFETYLASIPEVPAALLPDDPEFPVLLLVESRLGLKKLCEVANVAFDGDDRTFVGYDGQHCDFTPPTWIRVQDGRRNRNRAVRDCRKSFGKRELGLTAIQGVCLYVQRPDLWSDLNGPEGHALDLPGSVPRDDRDSAAFLNVHGGQALLAWVWDDSANPRYGSASRREC